MRASGLIAIKLLSGDKLTWVKQTSGQDHVLLVAASGKAIRFSESDARPMGRDTQGVRGINLKKGDYVVGMINFSKEPIKESGARSRPFRDILIVTEHGLGKRTEISEFPLQRRGGIGVKAAKINDKTGKVVAAKLVDQTTDQILITSKKAQVIKLPFKNIKRIGRDTQGVILMRFAKAGDLVAAVTTTDKGNGEDIITLESNVV